MYINYKVILDQSLFPYILIVINYYKVIYIYYIYNKKKQADQ